MSAAIALVFISVFSGVVAIFLIVAYIRSPSNALMRRLNNLEKGELETVYGDGGGILREAENKREQAIFRLPVLRSVRRMVERAGVGLSPMSFVLITVAVPVSTFTLCQFLSHRPLFSLFLALFTGYLPFACLSQRRQIRQRKFEEQLPDTLAMVARSLRAGHSLMAAVELISFEQPEPTCSLFRTAFEQQQLGMRTPDSLAEILERLDSIDLHFFVTIIRVNSETGGNLAEILEKLAETIRARQQIRRQVQTYTAEGRLSGYVLLALPVIVFILFYLKNPNYMEPFFKEPFCQTALVIAAVAQVFGFLSIRKIVRIRI